MAGAFARSEDNSREATAILDHPRPFRGRLGRQYGGIGSINYLDPKGFHCFATGALLSNLWPARPSSRTGSLLHNCITDGPIVSRSTCWRSGVLSGERGDQSLHHTRNYNSYYVTV